MRNRPYSFALRRAALDLYHAVGPGEAGRRLGIPRVTVSQWARRSRLRRGGEPCDGSAKTAAASAAAAAKRAASRRRWINPSAERRHLAEAGRLLDSMDHVRDAQTYMRMALLVGREMDAARVARGMPRG